MQDDELSIDIDERELSIIASLNKCGVRYLIVGGYAMLFYGDVDRVVNDVDIWVDCEEHNASKCWYALNAIIPDAIPPNYLSVRRRKIDLRAFKYDVEIFTSMDGAEFNDAFSRCRTFTQTDELIYVVGEMDLLAIKKEAHKSCPERMAKEAKDISFLETILNKYGQHP